MSPESDAGCPRARTHPTAPLTPGPSAFKLPLLSTPGMNETEAAHVAADAAHLATPLSSGAHAARAFGTTAWHGSELLASILDGVADGFAAHDASGQLLFINDAGARICGYDSPAAALCAPMGDFLSRVQVFDPDGKALDEHGLPGSLAARGRVVPERLLRLKLMLGGGERWL